MGGKKIRICPKYILGSFSTWSWEGFQIPGKKLHTCIILYLCVWSASILLAEAVQILLAKAAQKIVESDIFNVCGFQEGTCTLKDGLDESPLHCAADRAGGVGSIKRLLH